jgi:hypothetical protein
MYNTSQKRSNVMHWLVEVVADNPIDCCVR